MSNSIAIAERPASTLTDAMLCGEEATWRELLLRLPAGLDDSAKASGALIRRRGIQGAQDLLRMVFAYAVCDWSLRQVGAWLTLNHIVALSDVAILRRLEGCQPWLEGLVSELLRQRGLRLVQQTGVRLRLIDATQIRDSHNGHWLVHACFDLDQMCLAGLAITDSHGGESLQRFPGQPNEILLADRGYAHPRGLGAGLASGGRLVVRGHYRSLVLEEQDGQQVDVLAWLHQQAGQSSLQAPLERQVWLTTPSGRFALRLIVARLPPEALERAARRVRKKAHSNNRKPSADNLFAAGFILLLTNLSVATCSGQQILELYRLRWQVELLFKRYKSIFQLAALRAHSPQLVQTYLLGKLLAALLLDTIVHGAQAIVPDWFTSQHRPVSLWQLSQLFWTQLQRSLQGTITWAQLQAALPALQRYLCPSPRRRPYQLARARAFVRGLSAGQAA